MYHPFSVTETLSNSWQILKKNFATIAVYTILSFVITAVLGFVIYNLITDNLLASIGIVFLLISVSFLYLGFIKLIFQLIDKQYYDFEFADIVPKIKMLLSYIILLVLVSTMALFVTNAIKALDEGFIKYVLGIFSGLFFEVFFLFYFPICACFIVDDDSWPFESVAQSFKLIKGSFLKYFLLFLVIETLALIGSFTVIGLIFVVPFVNILLSVAYRKLIYSHLDVDDDVTETV